MQSTTFIQEEKIFALLSFYLFAKKKINAFEMFLYKDKQGKKNMAKLKRIRERWEREREWKREREKDERERKREKWERERENEEIDIEK